jgi:hypothetical protein
VLLVNLGAFARLGDLSILCAGALSWTAIDAGYAAADLAGAPLLCWVALLQPFNCLLQTSALLSLGREGRALGQAAYLWADGLGSIAGASIAGALIAAWGFRYPFWLFPAAASLLGFLVIRYWPRGERAALSQTRSPTSTSPGG